MYYTVYKVTNNVNGKIYIGCHKTNNLDDDYMGSGKIITYAHKKYGIENFEKKILKVFDNPEEMFKMESELVNTDFIKDGSNYNLKEGGNGGFDHINSNEELRITKNRKARMIANEKGAHIKGAEKVKWLYDNDLEWKEKKTSKQKATIEERYPDGEIFRTFSGKQHTDEVKKRIGEANSKHQSGKGNSQYGTMWIHSLKEKKSKKINKDDFSEWETKGWLKGRKMKFM